MVVMIIEDDIKCDHDPEESRRIRERCPTKANLNVLSLNKKKTKLHHTVLKWWQKPFLKFTFKHPHVKSRLEKLMESNVVSLTDRTYMMKLSERIFEDHVESMEKRIKNRELEETERIKNLVLTGRIPKDQAPLSMAKHPIMLIEEHCNKLINERRAKIKIPKVHIPTHIYYDDTPDPPSGLSIEKGHHYRIQSERLCNPITGFVDVETTVEGYEPKAESLVDVLTSKDTEIKEINKEKIEPVEQLTESYMFNEEEFDRLKFEGDLIEKLKECETVEAMYRLADKIIGELKNIDNADIISIISRMSELPPPSIIQEVMEKPSTSQDTEEIPE